MAAIAHVACLSSYEMADVIKCLNSLDIEAGIPRHIEALAAFVGFPFGFAFEADAALTGVELHDFRCAGIEGQRRRENHADGFLRAVGEQDGMRDAFSIEVDVGFLDDGNVVELCGHGVGFEVEGVRYWSLSLPRRGSATAGFAVSKPALP